ncbi:MAG: hypothetical protein KF700_00330 [Hyphomonadaceae bacterium]|nr:hypothetical protein [Hyphomonadaceae bacterium]
MDFLYASVGIVAGAILSWLVQTGWDTLTLSQSKKLLGKWRSAWQPRNEESGAAWVTETLTVRQGFGFLILEGTHNSGGYQWRAYVRVFKGNHVFGRWKSLRDGASSCGVLSLTMTPQGSYMFGVFHGPNDEGKLEIGPFVCARRDEDMEKAKARLKFV